MLKVKVNFRTVAIPVSILIAISALAAVAAVYAHRLTPRWRRCDFFVFNTQCEVRLYCTQQQYENAVSEAFDILFGLESALNRFNPQSELSRFNALPPGTPFPCSDSLWTALNAAKEAYRLTEGTFDITIGPLMDAWKTIAMKPLPPDSAEAQSLLTRARSGVGFDRIILDPGKRTATRSHPVTRLDFGGMAKGLALDLVQPVWKKHGIEASYSNFGGNLVYSGSPELCPFEGVGIEDPFERPRLLGTLRNCTNRFIATSSNASRLLGHDDSGKTISHIIDPVTGTPAAYYSSVTALAGCGLHSDVLSTAVFIKGESLAQKIRQKIPDTSFVLLSAPPEQHIAILGAPGFTSARDIPTVH